MDFSERPPSDRWAALKHGADTVAEVWFKPEGEPFALTFRIPSESFQVAGMGQRLTAENLLKAVGVAAPQKNPGIWPEEIMRDHDPLLARRTVIKGAGLGLVAGALADVSAAQSSECVTGVSTAQIWSSE